MYWPQNIQGGLFSAEIGNNLFLYLSVACPKLVDSEWWDQKDKEKEIYVCIRIIKEIIINVI